MEPSTIVHIPLRSRPPTLAPVRRAVPPDAERRLRRLFEEALSLEADSTVRFTEWKSVDSRTTPHTLHIVAVTAAGMRRHLIIPKANERVVADDVRAAVGALASSAPTARKVPAGAVGDAEVVGSGAAQQASPLR